MDATSVNKAHGDKPPPRAPNKVSSCPFAPTIPFETPFPTTPPFPTTDVPLDPL